MLDGEMRALGRAKQREQRAAEQQIRRTESLKQAQLAYSPRTNGEVRRAQIACAAYAHGNPLNTTEAEAHAELTELLQLLGLYRKVVL